MLKDMPNKRYTPKCKKPVVKTAPKKSNYNERTYPDCCNNRRIKANPKGLPPAMHRQQTLWVGRNILPENIGLFFEVSS